MQEIRKIGDWAFWPMYEWITGKEAEDFLIEKKNGEVKGAYIFEKRPVDLIRRHYNIGTGKGIWLAKIVAKHPEVLWKIQQLIDELPLLNMNQEEVILGDDNARTVIKLKRNWENKRWLMTAYEIKEKNK